MGAGACAVGSVAGTNAAVDAASSEELAAAVTQLSSENKQKLLSSLQQSIADGANESTNQEANASTNECTNEFTNDTTGASNECTNEGTNECTDDCANEEDGRSKGVKVTINMLSGSSLGEINLMPSECILELKRRIFELHDLPLKEQQLILNGNVLRDSDTLATYGFQHGGEVSLNLAKLREEDQVKIGICGLGRIGRLVFRQAMEHPGVRCALVNEPFLALEYMKYMLTYDTVHGRFPGTIDTKCEGGKEYLVVEGWEVLVKREKDPSQIAWDAAGVEYVVEATGVFNTYPKAELHIKGGAKSVVLASPSKDGSIPPFVMGVNHDLYRGERIVSNASCTTHCLAPLVKVLDSSFGIEEGLFTTVHSMTAVQMVVDGPSRGGRDWRQGRAASENIIPYPTGASKTISAILPEFKGKLAGMAFRVPTVNVSVVDLTCRLRTPAKYGEIASAIRTAARGSLQGILACTEAEVVSQDFVGNLSSSIVDLSAGISLNDRFVKVISWYDNEVAFTRRMIELICHMATYEKDAATNECTA